MQIDEARSGANRIRLFDDKYRAAVRLDYDGNAKKWLLTVYEDQPPGSEKRTSAPENHSADEALSSLSGDPNDNDKSTKAPLTSRTAKQQATPPQPPQLTGFSGWLTGKFGKDGPKANYGGLIGANLGLSALACMLPHCSGQRL